MEDKFFKTFAKIDLIIFIQQPEDKKMSQVKLKSIVHATNIRKHAQILKTFRLIFDFASIDRFVIDRRFDLHDRDPRRIAVASVDEFLRLSDRLGRIFLKDRGVESTRLRRIRAVKIVVEPRVAAVAAVIRRIR